MMVSFRAIVRYRDLDRQAFRDRYPTATLIEAKTKSRRRKYLVEDRGERLLVSVTNADSNANVTERTLSAALSSLGIPVPHVVAFFQDGACWYLVHEFVDGILLQDRLAAADKKESRRLGGIMGTLLQRLHSFPIQQFAGLPAPKGSWWQWIKDLMPELSIPPLLRESEPEIAFVHNDFLPHNIILKGDGSGVAALIDFEWSFLGDPTWDIGYLRWWVETGGYPYPEDCWEGIGVAYRRLFDEEAASFYASVRCPEPMEWWQDSKPPPIAWLSEEDLTDTSAP